MKTGLLLAFFCASSFAADPPVAYPHGYRQWTHVKTMHIKPGHPLYGSFGGLHHVYANKKALEGMKRGKYGAGATFVFDLLEARDDGFATSEGPRKFVAVMHKESKRYAATGNWGFEAFRGDSRKDRMVDRQAAAACFGCHAERKSTDYVFSTLRN